MTAEQYRHVASIPSKEGNNLMSMRKVGIARWSCGNIRTCGVGDLNFYSLFLHSFAKEKLSLLVL